MRNVLFVLLACAASAGAQTPPAGAPARDYSAPPDVATPPTDAVKSSTGLITKIIMPGNGSERPKATDIVTVDYTGWSSDGKMFDSSVARGRPATFPLNRVMAGWSECVQPMPL